jgi:prephenate dehydrogenase
MTVGVVGLGLIGASICKAYKENGEGCVVYATDLDKTIVGIAALSGVIDAELTEERIGKCDLLLVAIYPEAAIEWICRNGERFSKSAVVMDCCGTKRQICARCFKQAKENGFVFVGGHPMAGSHNSGYKYSRATLFSGAPMVIVPPTFDDIALLDKVKKLLLPLGFGKISVTDAENHDRVIAFSSQMAHVVSNAYVKNPTAEQHRGFSAGSYKDLTRVAKLNASMWSELFLENRDLLLEELTVFKDHLDEYCRALEKGDGRELERLLKEGSDLKERIDGR